MLTDSGQQLYDALAPLMTADADNGNVGSILCGAFATMLDPVAYLVRDGEDGTPGWSVLYDVANVSAAWLPWLGQHVGVDLSGITDVAAQRSLIQNPVGFNRGSVAAMVTALQATLTGTKSVLINPRNGGNAWTMTVATFTAETPDPQVTLDALMSQMPAWLIPTYTTVTGGSYATLAASHGSYTAMEAAHATYSDIPVDPAA